MNNKLGFVETLLCVIQGKCPVCGSEDLHSAELKGENATSCTACGWIESIEDWKRQATGGRTVLRMRDEFLQLVGAYNELGEYKSAQSARVMAIALNEFEDKNVITDILWPARIMKEDDHDWWLKRLEDVEDGQQTTGD